MTPTKLYTESIERLQTKLIEKDRLLKIAEDRNSLQMMVWKPFSTAPRDGSEFLAYGYYMYPGDTARTEYWYVISYERAMPSEHKTPCGWCSEGDEWFSDDHFVCWTWLTRPNEKETKFY